MGVQSYEWDDENKQYVLEGTLAEEKSDYLFHVGTRYGHWTELLELFRDGVVAINTIQKQYISKADEVRREQLNAAVELIEKQIERRASYERKQWDMGSVINSIPKNKIEDKK